ncbi:hypothetical protein GQ43DRAFT_267339 [Delitschia confertaspora ATCC 74209]|uniref:Uncharacterized protein n=1 Tax=Delitschia confertaspora ATCC 74209 TaxID=1513339 RepID=A0A9P4JUD7_9PLEO|nr:hypothetical protein GQ43DRAFT_267339 [Delitschia confertaspora ATCC 74209]
MKRTELPVGYERRTIRSQKPRLPEFRAHDNGGREPPVAIISSREPYGEKREFLPSENRFSVLAELDHAPNHTKWAFDFRATPTAPIRRRGRRPTKHPELRISKRASRPEGAWVMKPATPSFTVGKPECERNNNSEHAVTFDQKPNYSTSLNEVRHQWLPRFGNAPQQPLLPVYTTKPPVRAGDGQCSLPQPPDHCFTRPARDFAPLEHVDFRRKESRFFPLSAFMTTHSNAGQSPQTEDSNKNDCNGQPTAAQNAAASAACRALSNPKTISRPLTLSMGADTSKKNASPEAVTGDFSMASSPSCSSSPLNITTPSSTASPKLTTFPAIPTPLPVPPSPTSFVANFSQIATPSFDPVNNFDTSPVLQQRPFSFVATSPFSKWTSVGWPSSPHTASTTSTSTFISTPPTSAELPPSRPAMTPPPNIPYKIIPATPLCLKSRLLSRPATHSTAPYPFPLSAQDAKTQQDLESFLKMGHPHGCWCNPETSASASEREKEADATTQTVGAQCGSACEDSVISEGSEKFERIEGEEDVEDGWTVVVPEGWLGGMGRRRGQQQRQHTPRVQTLKEPEKGIAGMKSTPLLQTLPTSSYSSSPSSATPTSPASPTVDMATQTRTQTHSACSTVQLCSPTPPDTEPQTPSPFSTVYLLSSAPVSPIDTATQISTFPSSEEVNTQQPITLCAPCVVCKKSPCFCEWPSLQEAMTQRVGRARGKSNAAERLGNRKKGSGREV